MLIIVICFLSGCSNSNIKINNDEEIEAFYSTLGANLENINTYDDVLEFAKEDGKYERKVIYTKNGVEKEIDRDEMDKIFAYYNSFKINKRKVLEYPLNDEPDYLNDKKYIEKVNDNLKKYYDKKFTNFDVDKLLFKLKIKLLRNDKIYKFQIFEFCKMMEYHINSGNDKIGWLNMDSCNLNHNKDDSLTFNYSLIDLNNDGNNELIIFQDKLYDIYIIYNNEVFMLRQFDETHHLGEPEVLYDFYDNGMILESNKDYKWGYVKTLYKISNGQLESIYSVEYNNGYNMGDYIANENEVLDNEKLNKMLEGSNKIDMKSDAFFTVCKFFKEQIRLAREYRNFNNSNDKNYVVPILLGKYKSSDNNDDDKIYEYDGCSSFWLRDMGSNNKNAAIYTYFGNCSDSPVNSLNGVRPVMWVNFE